MKLFVLVSFTVALAIADSRAIYDYPPSLPYPSSPYLSHDLSAIEVNGIIDQPHFEENIRSLGVNQLERISEPSVNSGLEYEYPRYVPDIKKDVYLFVAPQEEESDQTRPILALPKQVHHKIIFIKAPSPPSTTTQLAPLPNTEEKTIIYVLVKKPEEPKLVISSPPPTESSKPEVYFIKYKSRKDFADGVPGGENNLPAPDVLDGHEYGQSEYKK
ncbi:hypothetical protein JTB14_001650 [Gonioctena quinquepunctata]|nr:hypothetical protein JTB14_001650 [Gonioctena quinquepunctata]